MSLRIANVTFDCSDPIALSTFWSAAFERPVDPDPSPHFASIGLKDDDPGPSLFFIKVPEAKAVKNRMHVDLASDDRPAEVARLVALGARHVADHDEWGHSWSVLQDPEENEFCVAG
jgi:predicted enzyme related to lactoylglutathione lyase